MFSIPVMRALSAYDIAHAALPATNAYMYFTPTADAAKQKQFTLHIPLGLIKSGAQTVFAAGDGASTNFVTVNITANNQLDFVLMSGGVYVGRRTTTRKLEDYAGFYFITLVMDTPNATALDRMRVYFDLTRETDFATTTNPAQNLATSVFNGAYQHHFLKLDYAAYYADVYLGGNTCLIGQALGPDSFLGLDSATGNVKAKDLTSLSPEYLFMFENDIAMGANSGSAGDATVSGTLNQVTSTPTDKASHFSPIDTAWGSGRDGTGVLSDGNKRVDYPGMFNYGAHITDIAFTDTAKIYGEALVHATGTVITLGLVSEKGKGSFNGATSGFGACPEAWTRTSLGSVVSNSITLASGLPTLVINDRFIFAFDMANGKGWFGKNGVWDSGDPALGTSPGFTFSSTSKLWHILAQGYNGGALTLYTSEVDWAYAAPTGFTANTTNNLPAQAGNVNDHFVTKLWNGNDTLGRAIDTGMSNCHFGWIKGRTAYQHVLCDAARPQGVLHSDSIGAEEASYGAYGGVAFNGTGLPTLEAPTTDMAWVNTSVGSATYVGWFANLPSTKTSGWAGSPTITPTKEIYNADLGMSIITYTGNGTASATIPHSLGKKPGMVIIKERNAGTYNWNTYHKDLTDGGYYVALNTTDAQNVSSNLWANHANQTSEVFQLGTWIGATNTTSVTYVAYIFAETDFIKIGSYIGNGSTDGTMVNAGISPVWVLHKNATTGGTPWILFDSERKPYNYQSATELSPNLTAAEPSAGGTGGEHDFVSSGIKQRTTRGTYNFASNTYIYLMIGQPNGPTENTAR